MNTTELKVLFKKYMKPEEKKHALLSASGSERWLGCPGSIRLSKGRPNVEHPSAAIGTSAHTLLQFILENPSNWFQILKLPSAEAFKKHIGFTNELLTGVLVAVKYITAERIKLPGHHFYTEKKLVLKGVGHGTTDVKLYKPFGLLHIIDYKNGKYKVSPVDNTQGLYYAVAAADEVGWDFSHVRITIIQPNVGKEPVKSWNTTPERLEKAKLMFQRGAAATKKADAPLIPNHKYCWFCPARQICPAQMKEREGKIVARFKRP